MSCPVNVRRAQPLPTGKKTGSYGTTVGKMGGDKGLEATAWRSGMPRRVGCCHPFAKFWFDDLKNQSTQTLLSVFVFLARGIPQIKAFTCFGIMFST